MLRGWGLILAACVVTLAGGAVALVPQFKLLVLREQLVRWQVPSAKTTTVTYGFVEDVVAFPRAHNCKTLHPISVMAKATGLATEDVRREILAGLKQWEGAAPLQFEPAKDWRQANILIGTRGKAEGSAFADVFPRQAAGSIVPIERSLMCFNAEHKWKIGFDGDLNVYDIRYVAAHEAGHAIGLDHPGKVGQLMSYRYQETFRTLQPGDVRGAQELYGLKPETIFARNQ